MYIHVVHYIESMNENFLKRIKTYTWLYLSLFMHVRLINAYVTPYYQYTYMKY